MLQDQRIGRDAQLLGLDHGDGLHPARDRDLHAIDDDLLGRRGDGHQARRALAVQRHARDRDREAGGQGRHAPDGLLHALRQGAAQQAVLDLGGIDARALDRRRQGVGGQRRRRRVVEGPAIGAADRGAGG
ncbi:hypothetical protein D3C86_1101850 [compost metagenome]